MYAIRTGMHLVEIGSELRMKRAGERSLWIARATSIICLLLLTWMTFVQVTHVHPLASDTDRCPICVAMHSEAPVSAVAEVTGFVNEPAPLPAPVIRVIVRRWQFTLFNRPPPAQA